MKIIFVSIIGLSGLIAGAQTLDEGNLFQYYERYQRAENIYHQLLQREPGNSAAWYELTRTYLAENKIDKAKDSIRLAPVSIQHDPYFEIALGSIYLNQNFKDSAATYFNLALQQTREKNSGILSAVARAHAESEYGNIPQAIAWLKKAIKRDQKNPALYVLLGNAYRKAANGSEAYQAYKTALEIDENYAPALHEIGEIFLSQKNKELYLDYFTKAVQADPSYAPSIYKLYSYYFYYDPAKALGYYKDYMSKSDPVIQNQYDLADLYYLNKQYDQSINKGLTLLNQLKDLKPRLSKLMAYNYAGIKDTSTAISYMNQYLKLEEDSNKLSTDFETMAGFYASLPEKEDSAILFYVKAIELEKDSAAVFGYYKKLANIAQAKKDFASEASWLEKFYSGNNKTNNLDLFNWGMAHYRAEDYRMADSVFGLYVSKYPEQSFGYYWQAKSIAAFDRETKEGLAIPVYQKLIEILEKDTTDVNYKKWMIEAYGYLAAYEANQQKDYAEAIGYFEKLLEVDPGNEDAKKYIAILEKNDSNR